MKTLCTVGWICLFIGVFSIPHSGYGAVATPYALTKKTYPSSTNMAGAAQVEYGAGTTVADWKDIKALYGGSDAAARAFCDDAGITSFGSSAWVLFFGSNLNGGLHHYFVERHAGRVPAGFVVNGSLGTHFLDLGTAVNVSKPILVKLAAGTPVIQTRVSPAYAGTTSGKGPSMAGKPVTLVATTAAGYRFVKWTENGVTVSGSANYTFTVTRSRTLVASFVPVGFVTIPGGSFLMGDAKQEGDSSELPVHSVFVSAFYMEATLVTKSSWDVVFTWALGHGYSFDGAGPAKASNHPVNHVTWADAVKWCNARSERAGLTPCYTVSGTVYRIGANGSVKCNWSGNGYRLPTEAEWEKAARGGLVLKRFPWGDMISRSRANYYIYQYTTKHYPYDTGTPSGYDSRYKAGGEPYTSPVGSFPANGYGLYDMSGNVPEWCWDLYVASYGSGALINPTGPASVVITSPSSGAGVISLNGRVQRGGGWNSDASNCRVSFRGSSNPDNGSYGFRCVLR